jgi:hypothetical protein
MLPALLIVVIAIFPCRPILNRAFFVVFDPVFHAVEQPHPLFHAVPERAGIATRIRKSTLMF